MIAIIFLQMMAALSPVLGRCDNTQICVIGSATPGCASVTAANLTIQSFISRSPSFEVISSVDAQANAIDNVCNTFWPFGDGTWLTVRAVVRNDGSYYFEKYIIADCIGHTGHFTIQGIDNYSGCSTCTDRETILGQVGDITVLYACNLFRGLQAPDPPNSVYMMSPNKSVSQQCFAQAVAVGRAQSCGCDEFGQAANKLPAKCVTSFNGAPCVNYQNVKACDSTSLPENAVYSY